MTPRARALRALALLLVLAIPLAACGKKALPEAPPGEPNTYPRVYPSQ
jgi:predicted small lipoprotein YifL